MTEKIFTKVVLYVGKVKNNNKTTIKQHQTTIIVSASTSILTVALIAVIVGVTSFANIFTGFKDISSFLNSGTVPVIGGNGETIKRDVISEESQIIDIVEKAIPAVVSIVITKDVPITEQYY